MMANERAESPVMSVRASIATGKTYCTHLATGMAQCGQDPYDAVKNPQGYINMGTSENYLMQNEIMAKLSDLKLVEYDHTMLIYNDATGHPALRAAIAEFLTERGNAPQPLDSNKIIVMNGITSCIDALAFSIGDPQDAFLCPTPYYGFILRDVSMRSQMQLFHVHLSSKPRPGESEPFQLTVERLEEALQQAKDQRINIRGLFLMNPHNPLGDVYKPKQLHDILLFCKRHHLHVVLDEIYLMSIFGEGAEHSSILRYKTEDIPDPKRTHFTWGFSKFLVVNCSEVKTQGIIVDLILLCPIMRAAMIYTWNPSIYKALAELAVFHMFTASIQHQLKCLLQDQDFLNSYFLTYHQRLRESHKIVTDKLKKLEIPYLHRPAGLYVWTDFSKYLTSTTVEAEQELSEKLSENKIFIAPSAGFYSTEIGWFRIIFSRERDVVRVGMERIAKVCQEIQKSQGHAI
ncbi:1-aminocyclopropane-1-carboxylate synthase-like protein 1 [Amphiura filiformis]|uniref:1-aminocyclopropane-1-carboxylate synthase-like protein 1 n=1 Tax=Amphiura filiformis TaxID=82378 RepID=UPI003B225A90